MHREAEKWTRRSSRPIADCRVFKVRQDNFTNDRTGDVGDFFVIDAPAWSNVIAVTKDRQLVLIEQFRQGVVQTVLEIPGGMIDENEQPLAAAKRELEEETGYRSENWVKLGESYPNPAIQTNRMHHFLAKDCELLGETNFDEHEDIVLKLVPVDEIGELISGGRFNHALAIAAFGFLNAAKIEL